MSYGDENPERDIETEAKEALNKARADLALAEIRLRDVQIARAKSEDKVMRIIRTIQGYTFTQHETDQLVRQIYTQRARS